MKLSELIRKREVATLTVATVATLGGGIGETVACVATVNVATETDGKPETLLDRQQEARRQKIIAMLEVAPGTHYALLVEDAVACNGAGVVGRGGRNHSQHAGRAEGDGAANGSREIPNRLAPIKRVEIQDAVPVDRHVCRVSDLIGIAVDHLR